MHKHATAANAPKTERGTYQLSMPFPSRRFVAVIAVSWSCAFSVHSFSVAPTTQPCASMRFHLPRSRIRWLSLELAAEEEQAAPDQLQETGPATVAKSSTRITNATVEGDSLEQVRIIAKETGNEEEDAMMILKIWNVFQTLKENLYSNIRQVFYDLYAIIQRSTQKTQAWVRDDAAGQLVSSALALMAFFAAVAAFAVWNIEVLGGKKFAAPTQVIMPKIVQLPESSAPRSVQFQKPKWQTPKITTSYSNKKGDESES